MTPNSPPRLLITGASGLLGRAIFKEFHQSPLWQTTGLSFTRQDTNLTPCDLTRTSELTSLLDSHSPAFIIHAAAERRPDISERDPVATQALNVAATAALANWATSNNACLIYISTDYVFDGTQPPYHPNDTPNPLNAYGASKLAGEKAVQSSGCDHIILRIPILYGAVEYLAESPVTVVATNLMEAPADDPVPMDDWAIRFPTHTADVASVLSQLLTLKLKQPELGGTYHFSGSEPHTRYTMAQLIAPLINFPLDRIVPLKTPAPNAAPRPQNAQLANTLLQELAITAHTPFKNALQQIIPTHLQDHKP